MDSYGSLAKFASTQRMKMEEDAHLSKMTIDLKTAIQVLAQSKQDRLAKMTIDLKTAVRSMEQSKKDRLAKMSVDLNLIVKKWALDNNDAKITY